LDKLTPKELLDHRERELKEKVEEIRLQWMERDQLNKEGFFFLCMTFYHNMIESLSVLSESVARVSTKEKKSVGKKNLKFDAEKVFQEKLEKGEL